MLSVTAVLANVVSAVSSAVVGTLYPTGHTDEPSVLDQFAALKLPLLSSAVQSKELEVFVIKLLPALLILSLIHI